MNGFSGLIVQHLYVKDGDFSCVSFEISCGKTEIRQTAVKTLPLLPLSAWVTTLE